MCFSNVQGYITVKCLYAYMKICIVFCSDEKHVYKAVLIELFLGPFFVFKESSGNLKKALFMDWQQLQWLH